MDRTNRQPSLRRPPGRRTGARGFTLLEVMVSLGILAIALLALGDLNGGAARMHAYATQLTVAVQLARGKMLDIQQQLIKDGLSDYSKSYKGNFEDEGWPEYSWKAQVIKPDFNLDGNKALSSVGSGLGLNMGDISSMISNIPGLGGGGAGASAAPPAGGDTTTGGGAPSVLSGLGPLGGLLDGQVKQLSEQVKNSVREIKLTVSWKAGGHEESFDVVQHIVQMPDAAQEQTANAAPLSPTGTPLNGQPGASGANGGGGQQLPPGLNGTNVGQPPLPGAQGF